VVLLVFSIIQNHLKPPRNNFQNYFEVREVFLSNSGTLPNILFATFQKLFWGVGSVKGNYFEVGQSVFEKIFRGGLCTRSTSD
jgi:hypothetical protein